MNPMFEFRRVSHAFGRQRVLDDVSFVGEPGSVIALLGENGAGKTTTIRILLGLLEPNGGTARVFGLDSWQYGDEIRRRVGYVPDRPALYDWMTVDEIGWFCAGFYSRDFIPSYRRLVSQFGLPLEKRIGTMSKGMKAKVNLALAIAHEPDLLVMDEPTSGLDPIVRREFLESMVDIAAQGRTVLLSSHQIAEVERVADVIAIIKHGKVAVWEPLEELKSRTRVLTLHSVNGTTMTPPVAGQVIHSAKHERQWQFMIRDWPEDGASLLREHESFTGLEIRQPTLEEIYVGYMQGVETPAADAST